MVVGVLQYVDVPLVVNTCPVVPVALYISLSSPVKRSLAIVDEARIDNPVALRYDVVALVNAAFVAKSLVEVELVVDALVAAKSVVVALVLRRLVVKRSVEVALVSNAFVAVRLVITAVTAEMKLEKRLVLVLLSITPLVA